MKTNPTTLDFDPENKRDRSRTQQQFKKEADINNIMSKYQHTGILVDPSLQSNRQPQFQDFSGIDDFQQMTNLVADAMSAFNNLPSNVRAKFGNDVQNALDFIAIKENADQARDLGLLPPLTMEERLAKEKIQAEQRKAGLPKPATPAIPGEQPNPAIPGTPETPETPPAT